MKFKHEFILVRSLQEQLNINLLSTGVEASFDVEEVKHTSSDSVRYIGSITVFNYISNEYTVISFRITVDLYNSNNYNVVLEEVDGGKIN